MLWIRTDDERPRLTGRVGPVACRPAIADIQPTPIQVGDRHPASCHSIRPQLPARARDEIGHLVARQCHCTDDEKPPDEMAQSDPVEYGFRYETVK